MKWIVSYSRKAAKQYENLPRPVQDRLDLLAAELELLGPIRYNWKNYSKLEGTTQRYHCHVKKGKPTYVACVGSYGRPGKALGGNLCWHARKGALLKGWFH